MASTAMSEQGGFLIKVGRWPADIKRYVGELQTEMRRVTWPTWPQVRGTTAVVIACVFLFAFFFFTVDAIMHRAVNEVFHAFTK
jgi:preprotein translocase subunit SecE